MKKILVTGATGFVGANLTRALVSNREIEVYISVRKNSDLWRIHDIVHRIRTIYYCNLDNRAEVFQLVEQLKPDIVYHTAAYGGLPNQTEMEKMIASNLHATINLLDASFKYRVQQFINTGSSSEYGIKNQSMKETDLCEPVSLYGISKLAATNYCSMIGKTHHYQVCTLRLFSPYGDLEDSSRLYPSIKNALKKDERPKLSRPDSVRDFIQIERVVEIYLKISNGQSEPGDIINVGSGKQQTINQFYNTIAKDMKKDIKPIWGAAPQRPNEPIMWEADISKLKAILKE